MYKKEHPNTIQNLFDSIAPSYDFANTVLSFGLHRKWNQCLIDEVEKGKCLLDLCAGTGEIALTFLKKKGGKAILLDFSREMLQIAKKKAEKSSTTNISFIEGDASAIPLEDCSVDMVTIAYGIRNVKEKEKCLQEVQRVLKKGGKLGILELTRPHHPFLKMGHRIYLKGFLPLMGKWITKNGAAYQYLSSSIQEFVSPPMLLQQMHEAGFAHVSAKPLSCGIATLFLGQK